MLIISKKQPAYTKFIQKYTIFTHNVSAVGCHTEGGAHKTCLIQSLIKPVFIYCVRNIGRRNNITAYYTAERFS